MKTFKSIGVALLAIIMTINFVACSSDNDEVSQIKEDEYVMMPLTLTGDHIEITDLPLARSGARKPYYVVKIEEFNTNTSKYMFYATGTFDDESLMIVKLNSNKKYRINTGLLYDYYSFGYIFHQGLTNKFNYTVNSGQPELSGGYETFYYDLPNGASRIASNIDSYYGLLDNYTPSSKSDCEIFLNRLTTGLEVVVEGLEEGSIKVDSPIRLIIEAPEIKNEIIFTDGFTVRNYLREDQSKENDVIITYYNDGSDPIEVVNEKMFFKRGYRKRILIKLNQTDKNEETNKNLSFTLEDIEIQDEPQDIYDVEV